MSSLSDELMKLILCCVSSFLIAGCCCGLLTSSCFIGGIWLISSILPSTAKPKLNFIKLVNLCQEFVCEKLELGEPLKVPSIVSELDFLKLATECKKLVCKKSNTGNPSSEMFRKRKIVLYAVISIGIISATYLFNYLNTLETRRPNTRGRRLRTHRPSHMLDQNFPYFERGRPNAQQVLSRSDISSEIPDHFCDEIFSVTMTDPVFTPQGRTYERSAIVNWITTRGTDPMSREPLSIEQLTPNRNLKEWLQKRPPPKIT